MFLEPGPHLAYRASDAAFRVRSDLEPLPPAGLARTGEGEVAAFRLEQPAVDPVVDRPLAAAPEQVGVVRDHVADGLPVLDAGREDLVHLLERLCVRVDAQPTVVEGPDVVLLRPVGPVVLLAEGAVRFLLAAVADVGGLRPPFAARHEELRAAVEAPRHVLAEVVGESAEERQLAFVEPGAEPVRASVALVAVDAPVLDFARNRGLGASDVLSDLGDGEAAVEHELDASSFVWSHVLCHGFVPLL